MLRCCPWCGCGCGRTNLPLCEWCGLPPRCLAAQTTAPLSVHTPICAELRRRRPWQLRRPSLPLPPSCLLRATSSSSGPRWPERDAAALAEGGGGGTDPAAEAAAAGTIWRPTQRHRWGTTAVLLAERCGWVGGWRARDERKEGGIRCGIAREKRQLFQWIPPKIVQIAPFEGNSFLEQAIFK